MVRRTNPREKQARFALKFSWLVSAYAMAGIIDALEEETTNEEGYCNFLVMTSRA